MQKVFEIIKAYGGLFIVSLIAGICVGATIFSIYTLINYNRQNSISSAYNQGRNETIGQLIKGVKENKCQPITATQSGQEVKLVEVGCQEQIGLEAPIIPQEIATTTQ